MPESWGGLGDTSVLTGLTVYLGMKAAAEAVWESDALAGKRILVTTVVPGLMRTGSYRAALFKGRRTTMYNLFAPLSTLPLTTISAARAARKIVRALERGDPELILTAHANVMVRLNGIAPATMQRALGIVARALPHGGGVEPVPGRNLGSPVDRSVLTALGRKAAADLNQR